MPKESDLQFIFNEVIAGKKQKVLFASKKHYESTRSNLLRKFRNYLSLLEELGGPNPFEEQFLRASWNSEETSGIFELALKSTRSNTPGKLYTILTL